jgi:hypothetical protein
MSAVEINVIDSFPSIGYSAYINYVTILLIKPMSSISNKLLQRSLCKYGTSELNDFTEELPIEISACLHRQNSQRRNYLTLVVRSTSK